MSPILGIIASQDYVRIPPSSYESIATATPTSGNSVTFSSIPNTYKSLQVRISTVFASNNNDVSARLNGDSTQIYTRHRLYGDGSTASSDGNPTGVGLTGAALFGAAIGGSTTFPTTVIMDLQDYASTTKYKTFRSFSGVDRNGSGEVNLISSLWTSTAAVTSLEIYSGANFATGTTISLYGIKG